MSTETHDGEALAQNVQANLVRVSKFADGRTRDWSLFLFFRILTKAEIGETSRRLGVYSASASALMGTEQADQAEKSLKALKLDLAQPSVTQAGVTADAPRPTDDLDWSSPADNFLHWLKVIVLRDAAPLLAVLDKMGSGSGETSERPRQSFGIADHDDVLAFFERVRKLLEEPTIFKDHLSLARDKLMAAAAEPNGTLVLPPLLFYEFLRQAGPAFPGGSGGEPEGDNKLLAAVHGEAAIGGRDATAAAPDRLPINIAFTHSGLKALGVHKDTLASFPDAFRQGMAARAQHLGDVGPSAPEHWEGQLGQPSIHGYFTGGFDARPLRACPTFWGKLRAEIRAFNDAADATVPAESDGISLREQVQTMFRIAGMELLHVELGQDPSQEETDTRGSEASPSDREPRPCQEANDALHSRGRAPPRREHFGFRDGLSQPFVNLKLGDTLPGGGAPGRRGGWTPVAPGEIFLSAADEDGEVQAAPVNSLLRCGSTYLVFRKLEQDVPGLRSFIARQHPDDKKAQKALAAQFVGRWPDGAPLVLSPYEDTPPPKGPGEAPLNDFRYGVHDPQGRLCPLGAHIRRANPRDTGGRGEVRHHRILRRGISYGGPMLPKHSLGDGEPRGMLFIAANARIDLQFEVIQAEWLNGGEFLGQAGLGRCPLTGSNTGGTADRFLARGAIAPVTGLPSFVTLRGGDYFFAPGLTALERIAKGDCGFLPDKTPYNGFTMGDVKTPALFNEDRLNGLGERFLRRERQAVVLAPLQPQGSAPAERIAFVGQHADVLQVLSNEKGAQRIAFSVSPYLKTGRTITRGHDLLIGTEDEAPTAEVRERLFTILDTAWRVLVGWLKDDQPVNPSGCPVKRLPKGYKPPHKGLDKIVEAKLGMALRSAAGVRRLDLIEDFASQAAYGVTCDILGLPGPNWVTEMAPALAYSKQHVGALPTDWLTALSGQTPADPGFTTMRLWTSILVADLIGNVEGNSDLKALSRQAGTELLNHIDMLTLGMRGQLARDPRAFLAGGYPTLLAAFVALESNPELAAFYAAFSANGASWTDRYYQDVAMILLEIAGSTLAVIPLTFSHVMEQLFDTRIDLSWLLGAVNPDMPLSRIVYEAERLNPNMPVRMRACREDTAFGKDQIKAGDAVAALIASANMDGGVFPNPSRFHLQDSGVCPMRATAGVPLDAAAKPRPDDKYLLFGVPGSAKYCWGANKVAMPVLEACVAQAGRLQGLRRVAGPRGEPQKLAGVTIGLQARFSRVLEKSPRKPPTQPPSSCPVAAVPVPSPAHADDKAPIAP